MPPHGCIRRYPASSPLAGMARLENLNDCRLWHEILKLGNSAQSLTGGLLLGHL